MARKIREFLTTHRCPGEDTINDMIAIEAVHRKEDGACIDYEVVCRRGPVEEYWTQVNFQSQPVEKGFNGITNEVLLAIVGHRLEGFQDGPNPCPDNAAALAAVRRALGYLHARTLLMEEAKVADRRAA